MTTGGGFDQVIDALGHAYRRRLLMALSTHNPQDDTDAQEAGAALGAVVDGEVDADVVDVELRHRHLPKLENYGYVSWDREEGKIRKGPQWDEIAPVLDLLESHADELPEDWL